MHAVAASASAVAASELILMTFVLCDQSRFIAQALILDKKGLMSS